MIRLTMTAVALVVAGSALAKLPPPDEAAKAKAAEAAAKTAWQGKMDAFLLCKVQDRIAAKYRKATSASTAAVPAAAGMMPTAATATALAPAAAPATAAAPAPAAKPPTSATAAAAAAAPATPAAPGAKPPTPTAATASQGGGTPVAVVAANPPPAPGCADPGPFAYAPPEQKPLEASGAHSPAANATSPPSVRAESGSMTSGKTGGTPKQ
jgi:hypothetical protein